MFLVVKKLTDVHKKCQDMSTLKINSKYTLQRSIETPAVSQSSSTVQVTKTYFFFKSHTGLFLDPQHSVAFGVFKPIAITSGRLLLTRNLLRLVLMPSKLVKIWHKM